MRGQGSCLIKHLSWITEKRMLWRLPLVSCPVNTRPSGCQGPSWLCGQGRIAIVKSPTVADGGRMVHQPSANTYSSSSHGHMRKLGPRNWDLPVSVPAACHCFCTLQVSEALAVWVCVGTTWLLLKPRRDGGQPVLHTHLQGIWAQFMRMLEATRKVSEKSFGGSWHLPLLGSVHLIKLGVGQTTPTPLGLHCWQATVRLHMVYLKWQRRVLV